MKEKSQNIETAESTEANEEKKIKKTDKSKSSKTVSPETENELTPKIKNNSGVELNIDEEKESHEILVVKDHARKSEQEYEQMSREDLVNDLETLVKSDDITTIKNDAVFIKISFLKKETLRKEADLLEFVNNGGNKEDFKETPDNITERFNAALAIYKTMKFRFNEEQEKQKQVNLSLKLKILEDLKVLIESEEELKKTYDAFKILQEKWKEIGLVPKSEINNLWQNYNFLVEKFFDKVKINKELKDLDLKKNLEAKIDLCEKTEELLLESSSINAFRQLQQYHELWREIGPVPQDKKDEIWERFRIATEKINLGRQDYYNQIKEEQEKNIELKETLCVKAEQLSEKVLNSAKEFQDETDIINELLKEWKTIGPAPKKQNDKLWERFKSAIDTFFLNKKDFFGKLKDDQINNYNQKLNLCLQAEAVKDSQEWKRTTEELIRLQHEWKKIGPVPKKYSDKIWKRFRAACDAFFNAKSTFFSNVDSKEEENLNLKKTIIQELKDYPFGDDKNENLRIIKDFQRKWMEIGHVPIKVKNEIHNEFREVVNQNLDKLKISDIEKNTINFKTKFENIVHNPGSNQVIYKEKTHLVTKISALKNDIKLWENNIGFFANSKNADVLKQEILSKIEKAKQDIALLEEKLKILKEVK